MSLLNFCYGQEKNNKQKGIKIWTLLDIDLHAKFLSEPIANSRLEESISLYELLG